MATEYEVLRIDQLQRMKDTQGIENYYRHQIKTAGGTVMFVDINEEDFSAEKAVPILTKAAVNADAILKS